MGRPWLHVGQNKKTIMLICNQLECSMHSWPRFVPAGPCHLLLKAVRRSRAVQDGEGICAAARLGWQWLGKLRLGFETEGGHGSRESRGNGSLGRRGPARQRPRSASCLLVPTEPLPPAAQLLPGTPLSLTLRA